MRDSMVGQGSKISKHHLLFFREKWGQADSARGVDACFTHPGLMDCGFDKGMDAVSRGGLSWAGKADDHKGLAWLALQVAIRAIQEHASLAADYAFGFALLVQGDTPFGVVTKGLAEVFDINTCCHFFPTTVHP